MATRGKSARRKGHNFEREVVNKFRGIGWSKAKRHLESQGNIEHQGIDLDNTYPFAIQCKSREEYVSINTIEEIKPDNGYIPVLITKGTRKLPMAVMPLAEFYKLAKKLRIILLKDAQ